jgi:zinc transport system permease protein
MIEKLNLFLSSWDIWMGAVSSGVIVGLVCGFIGIYVILHRIVFVSAAMSEVSSLGVMIAFWLTQMEAVHTSHHTEDILPIALAAIFTGLFSVFMTRTALARIADRSKSAEAFIGAVFLFSAAGVLLVGDRVSQGAHDISNVLFGNAVIVDIPHLILLASVCIPVLLLHIWFRKDILFISYDPATALTMGYPVKWFKAFLLISLGVVISVGTRTIGALPVFGFSVFPAMACLALFQDTRKSFFFAAFLGALSAFLGYLFSFMFSFPTGACMTGVAGMFLIFAQLLKLLFGR